MLSLEIECKEILIILANLSLFNQLDPRYAWPFMNSPVNLRHQPTSSRWVKCLATKGNIKGTAIQATELVSVLGGLHGLNDTSTVALGEATIAGLLLSSYCKLGERINLNIQGSGLIMQALVDAYPDGQLRSYVIERDAERAHITHGHGPWGSGVLAVLRTKDEEGKQPYIGTVPLVTGHLAKDLTFYWLQSEQVQSAVGISVEIKKGKVLAAGGFMIQALPGASIEEVQRVEKQIQEMGSFEKLLRDDANPIQLLSQIFQDIPFMKMEEKPLTFHCKCDWKRVERALSLIGEAELISMMEQEDPSIVKCDFCTFEYVITPDKIRMLLEGSN